MWELFNSLQQTAGNFKNLISPIKGVLIYVSFQDTLHSTLLLFDGRQHSINGRPQGAHLRITENICEHLEKQTRVSTHLKITWMHLENRLSHHSCSLNKQYKDSPAFWKVNITYFFELLSCRSSFLLSAIIAVAPERTQLHYFNGS